MFFQIMKASLKKGDASVNADSELSVSLEDLQIKPWSAESPKLYNLTLHVLDDGQVVEVVPVKVGFRHFGVKINSCF